MGGFRNRIASEQVRELELEIMRLNGLVVHLNGTIESLNDAIANKDAMIISLQEQVKELTRRTTMNSTNSSKPPSSDGYNKPKPKSLRAKTDKKPGGQPGHKGHNIVLPHPPDETLDHIPDKCSTCPHLIKCASNGVFFCEESRYVIEAVMTTKVIEHRRMSAACPFENFDGNEPETGSFPENVTAHIQYGHSFTALVGILDAYGAMSDSRISDILCGFFGVTICPGTIVNKTAECAEKVSGILHEIEERIREARVKHSDETGIRVGGGLYWAHTASTEMYTRLHLDRKRGIDGIEAAGILPRSKGVVVHDCWPSYWKMEHLEHATCGAHLLRELNGIEEMEPDHTWPGMFKELLLDMKSAKERAIAEGKTNLEPERLKEFEDRYDRIIQKAEEECPPARIVQGKRGRYIKRGKEGSLIFRLKEYRTEVTRFVYEADVPFDNNLAERDIRIMKPKLKVSGCFRSEEGAIAHLDIMSYFGTATKHDISAFDAMIAALEGRGYIVL